MDEKQMQEWMALAQPVDEHDFLKRLEGTWKAEVSMWMAPGAPPSESTGTMESKMILDGRYLRCDYLGDPGPMGKFAGMALDGYDRMGTRYIGAWMDTMGTRWTLFEGQVDGDVRTMNCKFNMPDGTEMKSRAVTTIKSDDEYTYESFVETPGGDFRNMAITYKRA